MGEIIAKTVVKGSKDDLNSSSGIIIQNQQASLYEVAMMGSLPNGVYPLSI
jgi:hypothetical protein